MMPLPMCERRLADSWRRSKRRWMQSVCRFRIWAHGSSATSIPAMMNGCGWGCAMPGRSSRPPCPVLIPNMAANPCFRELRPKARPLADAETILSDVAAAAAGATSAADFVTAIDDWFFAPGGGFETSGYLGSPAGQTGIPIDETTRIGPLTAADAPEIRAVFARSCDPQSCARRGGRRRSCRHSGCNQDRGAAIARVASTTRRTARRHRRDRSADRTIRYALWR